MENDKTNMTTNQETDWEKIAFRLYEEFKLPIEPSDESIKWEAQVLRRFCASPSALEAAGLCHKSDVDTMKEVSDSNRKDYMDLVMLLKGLVPDTYNLHVRVVADELLATCTQLRKRVEELDKASRNVIDLAEDFDASFYRRQSDLACALCDLAALLSDSEKEGGTAKPEAKTEERV